MKQIIELKLEQLNKGLSALENKRVPVNDVNLYREIHLEIQLNKLQINHLEKMLQEEKFEIVI